jgi:catechol-2,3-dioxygenase
VFHFPAWNAHAIYFWDPSGNLGELIARHDLPNATTGTFTDEDILYASEIGIVVNDVPAMANWAQANLQFSPYRAASNDFAPIGNEHQLLIVTKKPRPWFHKPTEIFSTVATLRGVTAGHFNLADYPYTIATQ